MTGAIYLFDCHFKSMLFLFYFMPFNWQLKTLKIDIEK